MRVAQISRLLGPALLIATAPLAVAQYRLSRTAVPGGGFERGGVPQALAGLGGLNNPQPSLADLDGDGEPELYLFDREGDVHLALERTGGDDAAPTWRYRPELTADWPAVSSFALLRDFDRDGVPDLFTYSSVPGLSGIEVYRGRREEGRVAFALQRFPDAPADLLYTAAEALIYVAVSDVPVIEDVDGDGDLDILSVDASGSYVRYYENVDGPGEDPVDPLTFALRSRCYGGVLESSFDGTVFLAPAPGECADATGLVGPRGGALHPGSTLGLADLDGDGDQDLLVGDVAAATIVALLNSPGADGTAHFTEVDEAWPVGGVTVELPFFPAVYPLPLAGPVTEYLATPSNPGGGSDYEVVWRYAARSGAPPELVARDYLTAEALDHGTGAHVALGDLTGDGIDDVLVGNDLTYNAGSPVSSLTLYAYDAERDRFVSELPAWLAELNALVAGGIARPCPALADLDGDGDLDLLLGTAEGSLGLATNEPDAAGAAVFGALTTRWQGIDVGSFSSPTVGDLSGDGLPDLLVGDRSGRLAYFPNAGSRSSPAFGPTPVEEGYGAIDVRQPGFPNPQVQPTLIEIDGALALYIGTSDGRLLTYANLPSEAGDSARLAAEQNLRVGSDVSVAFGRAPDGIGLAVVGNARGGLGFFVREDRVSTREPAGGRAVDWYPAPNPSGGEFTLRGLPPGTQVTIADLLGRAIYDGRVASAPTWLPRGGYVVRAAGQTRRLLVL